MVKDLKEILIHVGFSETEAVIYLFLFKKGSTTVNEISDGTKIPKSTIYDILEKFKTEGLISYLETKPKRKYIIESPKQILNLIEKEVKRKHEQIDNEYSEKKEKFNHALYEFLHEQSSERPAVRFFEGVGGLKSIREDIKSSGTNIVYNLYNLDAIEEFLNKNKSFMEAKASEQPQKHKSVCIYYSKKGAVKASSESVENYCSSEKFDDAEIVVYGKKIVMIDYRSSEAIMSVIVESKNISNALVALFKLATKIFKQ